jgi:outer membrane protein
MNKEYMKQLRVFAAVFFILSAVAGARPACADEILALPSEAGARAITLSSGIERVLTDNRLIKIALLDDVMAYQDALLSRSALLPQMALTGSRTFLKFQPEAKLGGVRAPTSDRDFYSFGVDVYQTLFDFGKNIANYRASKELVAARKAHTESIKRVAVLEFIIAYFDVLEAEKMIAVFEKETESLNAYLLDIGHLFSQGVAVKNDLLPAQVRLADAKQKLIAARNNREVACARLNTILAYPSRSKISVSDITMLPPRFPAMDDAHMTAQTLRPEVNFYEDQVRASLQIERAKAVENFPVIFLDGGYAFQENTYQVHQDNMSVQLGAKMNFYDGGAARAELIKERARQRQLKEQKAKIIDDIRFEIEDSFYGLKNACEKVLVAKEAVAQAGENVRVYRAKYAAGSATETEVLEAITLETIAQTNYFSDDYELKRGYAKLIYAMGIDVGLVFERMEKNNYGSGK